MSQIVELHLNLFLALVFLNAILAVAFGFWGKSVWSYSASMFAVWAFINGGIWYWVQEHRYHSFNTNPSFLAQHLSKVLSANLQLDVLYLVVALVLLWIGLKSSTKKTQNALKGLALGMGVNGLYLLTIDLWLFLKVV